MDSSYLSASERQTDMINVSDKPVEESGMNIKRVGVIRGIAFRIPIIVCVEQTSFTMIGAT